MERQIAEATSATMLVVRAHTTKGTQPFVLRIHTNDEWLAREPDLASREAAVLELLGPTAVPAPGFVAVDPDGAAAGRPCVLMERLSGRPKLTIDDEAAYVRELAGLMHAVHAVPAPELRPFARYNPFVGLPMPSWCTDRELWERALDAVARRAAVWSQSGDDHLVHRDFHPLNVLFDTGPTPAVTGVVDWIEARRGPVESDVAHCRMNLATIFGIGMADAFLDACALEAPYDPVWDLVSATDFFDAHDNSFSARAFRSAGGDVTD